jgi:hypothetical protein
MKRAHLASLLVVVAFASFAAADINRVGTIAEGREFPRVVDLDGNGIDDLVHDTYVLLGQGAGQFVKRDFTFGGDIVVADWLDVNGDGRVDLLSRHYGGRGRGSVPVPAYLIHIATGAPLEFGPGIEITPLGGISEPFIGDLDGDGKDDVLLVKILFKGIRDYAAQLTVQLSRGDGTFEKRAPFLIPTHPQWGRYSRRLLMGDMNRDGRRDVVIRTTDDITILTSDGGGDFTVHAGFVPATFGTWETDLGDIDGDGKLDVIAAGRREVRVYFGDGRGGFSRTTKLFLTQNRSPQLPSVPSHTLNLSSEAPRNLTVGEFITNGRSEITGSTLEGDIFFVGYENGALREVAERFGTEFVQGDLYVGSFRQPGRKDLLATYNLSYIGEGRPKPGLFSTNPAAASVTAVAPVARSGRGRAVSHPDADMKLRIDGKDCAADATIRTMVRQGMWGRSHQGGETFEALIDDDGQLYFRFYPKWFDPYPLFGTLAPRAGGGWEGTTSIGPWPCGAQDIRIVVER